MTISPLVSKNFPHMPIIEGVRMATYPTAMKYQGRDDLMLMVFDEDTTVAGVFTQSKTASANIHFARQIIPHGKARLLIVNAGNANAFNGKAGEDSIERIVQAASHTFDFDPRTIYPSSTGVIGEPLEDALITKALSLLKGKLQDDQWESAAKAIMTTDTFPKGVSVTTHIGGIPVTINGIIKGSGMIAPDMATLLGYVVTDAALSHTILQSLLADQIETTLNAITVDSDTSTSDTLLCFATQKVAHASITDANDPKLDQFKADLYQLLEALAQLVVLDGEGASKFVTIKVTGAVSDPSAKKIALSIANSPLVKTAIAGEDPNWGRIVMAVGKAGEPAERDLLSVSIGDQLLATKGQLNPAYEEAKATIYMQQTEIDIHVDLGLKEGTATIWSCDFTKEYIRINADYRS